jgi:hypothetical protein
VLLLLLLLTALLFRDPYSKRNVLLSSHRTGNTSHMHVSQPR